MKRAASALHKLASGNELKGHLTWTDRNQYEHEVASLQRFLVDASVSGGGLQTSLTHRLDTCGALLMNAPVPWRCATDHSGMSLRMHKARVRGSLVLCCQDRTARWASWCRIGKLCPAPSSLPCASLSRMHHERMHLLMKL